MNGLDRLANRVNQFYAEHIETLLFRVRSPKRLQQCGFAGRELLPVAALRLDDNAGCDGPLCRALIRRYARYYRRFSRISLPDPRSCEGAGLLAAIDLKRYDDQAAYLRQLGKQSEGFRRNARKAERRGYTVQLFQYRNHTPDIRAIRRSSIIRSCGLVLDTFLLSLDALGGAPTRHFPLEQPACPNHWELFFGVFRDQPGYMQGEIPVQGQLVAYARIHRIGNTVRYAEFIGHGDHVRHGIMMLLHVGVLAWLLDERNAPAHGVEFVTYGPIEQGSAGLFFWKRKALFVPHILTLSP